MEFYSFRELVEQADTHLSEYAAHKDDELLLFGARFAESTLAFSFMHSLRAVSLSLSLSLLSLSLSCIAFSIFKKVSVCLAGTVDRILPEEKMFR